MKEEPSSKAVTTDAMRNTFLACLIGLASFLSAHGLRLTWPARPKAKSVGSASTSRNSHLYGKPKPKTKAVMPSVQLAKPLGWFSLPPKKAEDVRRKLPKVQQFLVPKVTTPAFAYASAWPAALALDVTALTISLLATAVRAAQNSSAEVGAPMVATTSEEDVQLVTELAKTTVTIAAAAVAAVKFAAAMAKATATVATMAIAGPTTKLLGAAGAIALASDAQEGPAGGERSSQARMEQTLADVPLFALAAVEAALQAAGFQPLNTGADGKHVGAVAALRTATEEEHLDVASAQIVSVDEIDEIEEECDEEIDEAAAARAARAARAAGLEEPPTGFRAKAMQAEVAEEVVAGAQSEALEAAAREQMRHDKDVALAAYRQSKALAKVGVDKVTSVAAIEITGEASSVVEPSERMALAAGKVAPAAMAPEGSAAEGVALGPGLGGVSEVALKVMARRRRHPRHLVTFRALVGVTVGGVCIGALRRLPHPIASWAVLAPAAHAPAHRLALLCSLSALLILSAVAALAGPVWLLRWRDRVPMGAHDATARYASGGGVEPRRA